MYRVIKDFKDVRHNMIYYAGDDYPAEGKNASKTRLNQLSTTKNKTGMPLIEKVEEQELEQYPEDDNYQ